MFRTSDTAEDKSTDTKDKSVSTRLDPSSACSAPGFWRIGIIGFWLSFSKVKFKNRTVEHPDSSSACSASHIMEIPIKRRYENY